MFPIRDHNHSNRFPLITISIIALNAALFFIELTTGDLEAFLYTYALVPSKISLVDPFSWWPFVSSMFLHGGWLHILSNMWFLWIFGDNIEATLGHIKYLLFYLFTGILAGLAQYFVDPASSIPMLGASGAIAGVLGGYLVLFPHAKIETIATLGMHMSRINVPASVMLVYWFATQIFSGVGSIAVGTHEQGGVAFFAHAGGFAAGWLVMQVVKPALSWRRIE